MDNQDKIFNRFKEAADNAETKDFPGMEKVWSRLEDKLDRKEDKKTISLWKKIAVAASLLLVISLGYQFLKTDKKAIIETPKVVVNENETIKNTNSEKTKDVVSSDSQLVPKEEAVKILEKQSIPEEQVAVQEITSAAPNAMFEPIADKKASAESIAPAVASAPVQDDYEADKVAYSKEDSNSEIEYKAKERESAKVALAAKQSSARAKKSAPLVILNGNAMAHSDDVKKDKMMQSEMTNLEPENVESLVILDEPLYIIDGIYYSENDLFGNNPTSPYAPLDKQDIKTITILQDLEATSKYGERGKKGVVIITTKTGKPAPKK